MKREDFRSGYEFKVAKNLEAMDVKVLYEVKTVKYEQPVRKYHCLNCGQKAIVKERSYTIDFLLPDGSWLESKGKFTGADRVKMLAIQECYPDQVIRLLFMRNNFTTKKKLMTYSEWAEKHGFSWAVSKEGYVPDSWCGL